MTLELIGLNTVKKAIEELRGHYKPALLRTMLDAPGRIVVKEAKARVTYPGQIGDAFRQDIAVQRDKRRTAKDAEYIVIGPRFRSYSLRGKDRKVALVAQHLTVGFRQTDRRTRSGQLRGRVALQMDNPMRAGLEAAKPGINQSIDQSIQRNIEKLKAKYSVLVR